MYNIEIQVKLSGVEVFCLIRIKLNLNNKLNYLFFILANTKNPKNISPFVLIL